MYCRSGGCKPILVQRGLSVPLDRVGHEICKFSHCFVFAYYMNMNDDHDDRCDRKDRLCTMFHEITGVSRVFHSDPND